MAIRNLYIQQISYDGTTYTKGELIDTYNNNIGIKEIPFKYASEFKDIVERDWPGEDGVDIYVPSHRRQKKYEIEIEFIYKGTNSTIHSDLRAFIDFFRGIDGSGNFVQPRFAMYDEQTKIGRKDVVCNSSFNDVDLFYYEDYDEDGIASFKLKFDICDPVTDISLSADKKNLVWEGYNG